MMDNDVECEIWSIFQGTMQNDPNFSFLYLQVTGVGAKSHHKAHLLMDSKAGGSPL